MTAGAKEQAARKGAAWAGRIGARSYKARGEERTPRRAPPATYADSPQSITAALLGDPLPGQSALDKRGRA